jgi:hypothetical protein
MEIRNQLMHNIMASSYEKCFSYLPNGKDKWILKTYPPPTGLSQEKSLEYASKALAEDISKLIRGIIKSLNEKEEGEKKGPSLERKLLARDNAIKEIEEMVDRAVGARIKNKKEITSEK